MWFVALEEPFYFKIYKIPLIVSSGSLCNHLMLWSLKDRQLPGRNSRTHDTTELHYVGSSVCGLGETKSLHIRASVPQMLFFLIHLL